MAKNEATLLLRIKQAGGEILDRFVITLGDVLNLIGKIPGFLMDALNEYKQSEQALNGLNQSMVNAGTYTSELSAEYVKMASALQKVTTFSDDQIVSAQASLQALIGQKKVSQELLQATLDLAAGKKIDLATAAELVGKTIGTETDALKRQGITVKESTDDTQKYANVIDAINDKFKGQSQQMATGIGVMDQVKNSWSDFLENVGRALAPFATSLGKATIGVLEFFNSFAGPDKATMTFSELTVEINKLSKKILELQQAASYRGGLNEYDKALIESLQNQIKEFELAKEAISQKEAEARANEKSNFDQHAAEMAEKKRAQTEVEILDLAIKEQLKTDTELAAQMARLDAIIANEDDQNARLQAIRQKDILNKKIADSLYIKTEKEKEEELKKSRGDFLNQISTLQGSSNKALAAAGKAAAIAQITISTAESAQSGYKWGMALGGPGLAAAFSGLAYVAGAAQIAKVNGVQLAEGGIVKATPGGVPAVIGEGGQDEAVIPLDRAGEFGMGGGGVTVNFNGPIMGNESQAEEFARAIDKQLLKLRQSNQSVAFERDVV